MNAEATQHEWCENEKETSVKAKTVREKAMRELQTSIEGLTGEVESLKTQIFFHQAEVKRIKHETEVAKKIRKRENKAFKKAKADHDEVIAALKTALQALGGTGFVQLSAAQEQSPFGEYQSAGGAASAMEMLQDLESRYTKALEELTKDENDAQADHEQLLKDNAQLVSDNTNQSNSKMAERREKLGLLATDKVDLKTNTLELHEVNNYLKDLRPSCDDIRSTFDERKRRREAEISALKEALDVISDPTGGD